MIFRQRGSVRIPPRASRFAPGDSAQSLLVGKTERCFWRSLRRSEAGRLHSPPARSLVHNYTFKPVASDTSQSLSVLFLSLRFLQWFELAFCAGEKLLIDGKLLLRDGEEVHVLIHCGCRLRDCVYLTCTALKKTVDMSYNLAERLSIYG